ncbi:MAG: Gfo/Idh/MocA family protein [Aeromicrobium sp.]
MAGTLNLGVIGLGGVFEPYCATIRDLRAEGRLRVVRTCDLDPRRASRVQRFLGEEIPFSTDAADVIADPAVDAVLVITSMPAHAAVAKVALEAGKHVLVEKPMAIGLAEAAELIMLAKDRGVTLVPAPHVVLSPTFQAMWKRVVHEQAVGKVHLARARYGWSGPWWGQWFYRTGGGPLFDLGVYNVTSLTAMLGSVLRVTAMAGTAIPRRVVDGEEIDVQTEDNFQILLDHGDATFSTITTGFTMQEYRTPAIELYGGDGTIQMLGDDWAPNGYEMWTKDHGAWSIYGEVDPTWHWTSGLRHLVDVVLDGQRQLVRPEHAYHALEVMIKATVAARTGQTQAVDSRIDPMPYDPDRIELRSGVTSHDKRILRTGE